MEHLEPRALSPDLSVIFLLAPKDNDFYKQKYSRGRNLPSWFHELGRGVVWHCGYMHMEPFLLSHCNINRSCFCVSSGPAFQSNSNFRMTEDGELIDFPRIMYTNVSSPSGRVGDRSVATSHVDGGEPCSAGIIGLCVRQDAGLNGLLVWSSSSLLIPYVLSSFCGRRVGCRMDKPKWNPHLWQWPRGRG